MNEQTPLLSSSLSSPQTQATPPSPPVSSSTSSWLYPIYQFLNNERSIPCYGPGSFRFYIRYESFMMTIITVNVICYIVGTVFVAHSTDTHNDTADTTTDDYHHHHHHHHHHHPWCYTNDICDMILFGNFMNNGLQFLQIGATSVLELVTVLIFTLEYIFRFSTAHYIDPVRYRTIPQRIFYYIPTFHSVIDLLSILPFYIDAFLLPNIDVWNVDTSTTAVEDEETDHGSASNTMISTTTIIYMLRMLRLFRMMRIDTATTATTSGTNNNNNNNNQSHNLHQRYNTALSLIDDVIIQQSDILLTTSFVGITIWIILSSSYYIAERQNPNMIYCPVCYSATDNTTLTTDTFDPSVDCVIDTWGIVDCTTTSTGSSNICYHCYHRYESIPMASYYTLLNLFGEYPLIQLHSLWGRVIAAVTAIVAVAVFAIPVGIIGNGLQTVIVQQQKQREREQQQQAAESEENIKTSASTLTSVESVTTTSILPNNDNESHGAVMGSNNNNTTSTATTSELLTPNFIGNNRTFRGKVYNIFHSRTYHNAMALEIFINLLIVATVISFMMDTVLSSSSDISTFSDTNTNENIRTQVLLDSFELISVIVFTLEYIFRIYSITEDPKYQTPECNRWTYMCTFLPVVDFISFAPYWIEMIFLNGTIFSTSSQNGGNGGSSNIAKSLRLLRILRFERYTHAFTTFDDVILQNIDILTITAVTAIIFWIVFSTLLYYTERNSYDTEIADNYNHIPNAMWITLLNLSGEAPLSQYSMMGKVITAVLGLFATGIFGIPIGVLGAGFERIVTLENQDNVQELENIATPYTFSSRTSVTSEIYKFVNGIGSVWAQWFEGIIYLFILLSVAVGVWQTVDGHTNDFHQLEWIAVIVFTIEYILRFIGAGADPEFNRYIEDEPQEKSWSRSIWCRLRFIISFYSVIDLLAIIPFYVAFALPNTFVNDYDEYFRMFRIVRLLKLDKYVPSISLIDDVIRLKFSTLRVAFYAAATLWILFAAALYVCEHDDTRNAIDPVPKYGCRTTDCTMSDRFQNFFDSMVYTGIHLTGDYPIITYSWSGRMVNFFMVIAAVGVVSIPSGLIASGFVEIVRSKNISKKQASALDDDWYEVRYRSLEGTEAPVFSGMIDHWQFAVDRFLNGQKVTTVGDGGETYQRTVFGYWAYRSRIFIFIVIILNVFAVILESIPKMDKYVGNERGNFFDTFELFSVLVFATEYMLRLFSAPKNREALYSTMVYATTFFGIVDFLSTAPWFIEQLLIATGLMDASGDFARIFRIFRIFRILQLEDFIIAFSKLDNVFRESKDVLKATGLMAFIVWIGCGALFFIFEENNPNWRSCDVSIPPFDTVDHNTKTPGCFDFPSTTACNEYYPGMCQQSAFTNMPDALYYTAIFLGGEWGVVDFTWPGRIVCLFLCVVGIGLYSIPIGTLFDSFGKVLGLDDDDEDADENDENS